MLFFEQSSAQTTFTSGSRVRSPHLPFQLRLSINLYDHRPFISSAPTLSLPTITDPNSDTLIVWTEPDGVDYALSFQDPEGCSEVWNFITEVQQHMNNVGE